MATTKIPQELLEKTSITFADNEKLNFGTSNDLQIYHDSSIGHSVITDVGTGNLLIRGTSLNLQDSAGYNYIVMEDTGSGGVVKLRHNDVTKFYTNASGVDIVGTAALTGGITIQDDQVAYFGTGLDLRISHVSSSGSNLIQSYTSGELVIESNGNTKIRTNNADDMAKFLKNGAVELYYDNAKKFETTSSGISVTGGITATTSLSLNGSTIALDTGNDYMEFSKALFSPIGYFVGTTGTKVGHLQNSAGVFYMEAATARQIAFGNETNGEFVRIDADGRLLIGTAVSLHGSADLQIQGASGNYARILMKDRDGTNQNAFIDATVGNLVLTSQNGTSHGPIRFSTYDGTDTLERMRVHSTGHVGIGTNSPTAKLHISGNSDVSDEDCQLIIDDVDGSAGSRIPSIQFRSLTSGTVTNQGRIRATDSQGMVISASAAQGDDLVVQAGKVGIGGIPTAGKLDIVGGTSGVSVRVRGDVGAGAYYYGYMFDGTNVRGTTQTNIFYSGSAIAANTTIAEYAGIRIDQPNTSASGAVVTNNYAIYSSGSAQKSYFAGKVGIGATSPDEKLHVDGQAVFEGAGNTNRGNIIMGAHGSGSSKWATLAATHYNDATGSGNGSGAAGNMIIGSYSDASNNNVYIGGGPYELNPATHIRFYTHNATTHNLGGTEKLTIDPAGDIIIGSTSKIYSSGDTDSYLQFNQANTLRAVIGDSTRMIINTSETVFNEDSGDFDFRIEGDDVSSLFHVNAGANVIQIGQSSYDVASNLESKMRNDRHDISQRSYGAISGSGQPARWTSGTVAVATTSAGTQLQIPCTSQVNLWRPFILKIIGTTAEYNYSAGNKGFEVVMSGSLLSYVNSLTEIRKSGNVASIAASGMDIHINFTNAYNAGLSDYEGLILHYELMSITPSYVKMWQAVMN